MSDSDTVTAPPKPKAKPAQSPSDKRAFAHVEKWMQVVRELNEESKR
ncbi:MAG: hypothetical protein WB760_24415 [Xanthobacteraceae bacterium]